MPPHQGLGFTTLEPLADNVAQGYRHESVPNGAVTYHNYHFTRTHFDWPEQVPPVNERIDGFSPNLNKELHIGHLRNLVVGSSIVKISGTKERPVAMLGACLGIKEGALQKLQWWYKLAKYAPDIYMDVDLIPQNYDYKDFADGVLTELKELDKDGKPKVRDQRGCKVTPGPDPVIVRKASGQASYAMHDLMFAVKVKPTKYVTAGEQSSHFKGIGLSDKHLPMGIVLGADGKKMRSRTGDAFPASDALKLIQDSLREGSPTELAWNVLAWNFLAVGRAQNVTFDPTLWANPDSGGLYITYTQARVKSALTAARVEDPYPFEPLPDYDEVTDLPLLAMASYFSYYLKRARMDFDPCPIANYALSLAKRMGQAMELQRVIGGTRGFQCALWAANSTLRHCMELLTMNVLDKV